MRNGGATKSVNVLVARSLGEEQLKEIAAVSNSVEITYHPCYKPNEMPPMLEDADVILGYYLDFAMQQAPNLRWAHFTSAGTDYLHDKPIWQSDVTITNSHIYGTPIAEYVFASILCFSRRLLQIHDDFQRAHRWPEDPWNRYQSLFGELQGRTLGIVGYGEVGRKVAVLGSAFGMHVQALDIKFTNAGQDADIKLLPSHQLEDVIAEIDVLVLCVPLTPMTKGMINERILRRMKPTAFLVNVARGEIVKEQDLVKALKKHWIAGAGLDVFEQEPLPGTSELFDLDNVVLTPHIAGASPQAGDRVATEFAENLQRFMAGEPLKSVVDRAPGF